MQINEAMFGHGVVLQNAKGQIRETRRIIRRQDGYRILWDSTNRGILIEQPVDGDPSVFVPWTSVLQLTVDEERVNSDGRVKGKIAGAPGRVREADGVSASGEKIRGGAVPEAEGSTRG